MGYMEAKNRPTTIPENIYGHPLVFLSNKMVANSEDYNGQSSVKNRPNDSNDRPNISLSGHYDRTKYTELVKGMLEINLPRAIN